MYLILCDFATAHAYTEPNSFSNFLSYIIADLLAFSCAIAYAHTGENPYCIFILGSKIPTTDMS